MGDNQHNQLIKTIAAECFRPYGIIQKGQSRTFLKDHGWYTIIIEFQPSSWSKGTYLNIGVDCHFFPQEHLSFSYAHRESAFEEFESPEQFSQFLHKLCEQALRRITELETEFSDPENAVKTLNSKYRDTDWKYYDLAILNSWIGDFARSRDLFQKVLSEAAEYDWQKERQEKVKEILGWMEEPSAFSEQLGSLIKLVRAMKKLEAVGQV